MLMQIFNRLYATPNTIRLQPTTAKHVFKIVHCHCGTSMMCNSERLINSLESSHSRFNRKIEKCHPNVWEFIKLLRKEQLHTETMIHQANAGHRMRRQNKKCQQIQRRIEILLNQFRTYAQTHMELIRGVSHTLADPLF